MSKNIAIGIDIGTHEIKVVVVERIKDKPLPRIIGVGFAESHGLRHGYVINQTEATKNIKQAVEQAEKVVGFKIKKAFISVGGIGLGSVIGQASTITSKADSEITDLDIKKVHEICENELPQSIIGNKKIIHAIPIQYKIDGKQVLGRPEGMKGNKLDARILFITSIDQHIDDLVKTVEDAGVEVEDVVASPIASSLVILSKQQKIAGCVLANIGSETTSLVIYENDLPISLEVFGIGSTDITNDIALGLKISLEEAEQIKLGTLSDDRYPRKKLDEIITSRLSDIFDLIEIHLKKIGRNGLLPAGIVLTGGGSYISSIEDLAKSTLKLPSKMGVMANGTNAKNFAKDSILSVASGCAIVGLTSDNSIGIQTKRKDFLKQAKEWLKQFMP